MVKCPKIELCQVDEDGGLVRYLKEIHYLANELDNAIYEIDLYDPLTFFHVVRVLEPIIEMKK